MITVNCPRCNGTGHYSYHPQHGTVCFKCNGAKVIEYTDAQYKALQRRRNKAAELKEIKEEERKANRIIIERYEIALIARYENTEEFKSRTRHCQVYPMPKMLQLEAATLCGRNELDSMGVEYFNSYRGINEAIRKYIITEF